MAPLSPDNTPRFKVTYTNQGLSHTLDVRSSASPATLGTAVDALFTALSPILPATSIGTVEFAPSGSSIFNPVTSGIEGNTYGSGAGAPANKAQYISFVGRSSGGRRARAYVFGINAANANDYRYVLGEDSNVDNAIAAMQAMTTSFLAIDGIQPVWKSYANTGVNAHLQQSLRP